MSKILPATCQGSVVTVEGQPVEATILSQGTKSSSGVVLLEEAEATYIASNASDIVDVIAKLKTAINKIADTLTDIGSGMTGPTTAPPPTLPVSVLAIQTYMDELEAIGENLK